MEQQEELRMQLGVHITHNELIQYEVSEAISKARRWFPQSDDPNPIIQFLKERNLEEEEGWLRVAEFGKDRVGCHNNAEEKEYIHRLYEPVSEDYSCRLKFAKELSKAWKYSRASLIPLFDTIDETRKDEHVEEEIEKVMLHCESWTCEASENPLLSLLETRNKKEAQGWLRAALFGRDRVGKNQNSEESECLSTLYSRAKLPEKPTEYFKDFVAALSFAWAISPDRLRKRLKQKKGAKSSTPPAPSVALSTCSADEQIKIQDSPPHLITPSNEESNNQKLQPSFSSEQSSYPRIVTPTHDDDDQQRSPSTHFFESSESIATFESQREDHEQFVTEDDLQDDLSPMIDVSEDNEQDQDEFQGFDTTAFKNIQDVKECPATGLYILTQKDSIGRTTTRRIMAIPNAKKSTKDLETGRVPRQIIERANIVTEALNRMDQDDRVLNQIVKAKGYTQLQKEGENELSVEQAILLRDEVGTSTNGLVRIDQALRGLKGTSIFPKQLKKKVAEFEREQQIDVEVHAMEMILSKQSNLRKDCNFSFVKRPEIVLDRLVEAAKVAGKFQPSFEWCSLDECLVFPFGGDRGGSDYTILTRLANRIDGNSGFFCQPLCQVEDGAECYENMAKGPFNKDYPIQPFLQDLVDDRLIAATIDGRTPDNKGVASKCVTMKVMIDHRIFDETSDDRRKNEDDVTLLTPKIRLTERGSRRGNDAIDDGTADTDRSLYLPLNVLEDARDDGSSIELSYQFLWKVEDDPCTFVGLQLFFCDFDEPVFSYRFELPFVISENDTIAKVCPCIGIPAHDTKQGLILSGQGTATDSCACLTCISLNADFCNPQSWMVTYDPSLKRRGNDAPLREGEHANEASYERFKEATADGNYKMSENKLRAIKKESYSVTVPVLLNIHPHKDPAAPMHAMQGHITHLLQAVRDELREIDVRNSNWMRKVRAVSDEAEELAKENAEFRMQHKHSGDLQRKINGLKKKLERKLALRRPLQDEIEAIRQEIRDLEVERQEHSQNSGYGLQNKLIQGAQKASPLFKKYLSDTSRKSRGEAEFVYNRAIEIIASVRYRPEHTGFELSNADGIKVLKSINEICAVVAECYADEPAKRAKVKLVLERLKAVAVPLLPLCLALKSQKKITLDKQELIRQHQCSVWAAWRVHFPTKSVFLKMHHMVCAVPRFINKYHMYYRIGEEGFEGVHPVMEKVKGNLKSIVNTEARIQTMYRRFQVSLASGVEAGKKELDDNIKTGPRGRYAKVMATRKEESLSFKKDVLWEEPAGYVHLVGGEVMKKEWMEVYSFVQSGIVPASWWNAFEKDETLGDLAKEKVKYSTKK